jgi:hypothetical protein
MTASGGTPAYTWSVSDGSLPPGLSLNSSTGAISGTPTAAGTYSFTVKVTDNAGVTATKALSILINAAPAITTVSLPAGDVGVAYSRTLTASSGTSPYTWSILSGSLPTGLSLNSSTGAVYGIPTVAGTYSFTVKVTDNAGVTATKALSILINAAPAITTVSLPAGDVGVAYSQTLTASGGTSPYTWLILSGSLPTGLSLNSSNGTISGTPTKAGTYSFTVKLTDTAGGTVTQALSITINVPIIIS